MIARQTPQQRRGQGNFLDVDPQVVDFGTIFISHASMKTVEIRSSRLRDVSVCSQLVGVVYFKDNQQQIDLADCIASEGATHHKIDIFFRPDRPGKQEKYIQVKSKSDSRLELDITIMADVCLLPRLEHLGMALVEGRKYFSQMMDSQKPLRGAVQIEIRDAAVQDYKIPFRCLTQDEETIPALSFKFSLVDSRRREGCCNMRLEEHGIELSLRK